MQSDLQTIVIDAIILHAQLNLKIWNAAIMRSEVSEIITTRKKYIHNEAINYDYKTIFTT